jgi:hypothetical protein
MDRLAGRRQAALQLMPNLAGLLFQINNTRLSCGDFQHPPIRRLTPSARVERRLIELDPVLLEADDLGVEFPQIGVLVIQGDGHPRISIETKRLPSGQGRGRDPPQLPPWFPHMADAQPV